MWSFSVWSVRFCGWLWLWLCRHRFILFFGCFFFTERWKSSDKNEWRHDESNSNSKIASRHLGPENWRKKTFLDSITIDHNRFTIIVMCIRVKRKIFLSNTFFVLFSLVGMIFIKQLCYSQKKKRRSKPEQLKRKLLLLSKIFNSFSFVLSNHRMRKKMFNFYFCNIFFWLPNGKRFDELDFWIQCSIDFNLKMFWFCCCEVSKCRCFGNYKKERLQIPT